MLNIAELSRRWPYCRAGERICWKKFLIQLFALTISYGYDAAGQLISVDYSDRQSVAYSYDDAGNITYYSFDGNILSGASPLLLLLSGKQ